MDNGSWKDTLIEFKTSQGVNLQAYLKRMTRLVAVFEVANPSTLLRVSEVLNDFRIICGDRTLYSGKAVISNLVHAGLTVVGEVTLEEDLWMDVEFTPAMIVDGKLRAEFQSFVRDWQKLYRVLPEFKVIVADIQTFLNNLRLWLDQVELRIRSSSELDRGELERDTGLDIGQCTTPALDQLFEKFEDAARKIEPELTAVHSAFARRILHPLLMSSPFLYRTFHKPLGYAGDYEMVNMIMRDPMEGGSLFAKVVNLWFLTQPPAEAHRNRIIYLSDLLANSTVQATRKNRTARFFNLGCGPCQEVQDFMTRRHYADSAHFTLLDFNQETLQYAQSTLSETARSYGRRTSLQFTRQSVNQVLKEASARVSRAAEAQYDVVYCAGLFDYLTDAACRRLCNALYEKVAPGGMLVVTNVDRSNPRIPTMDHIMAWHLIYRDAKGLLAVKPDLAEEEDCRVHSDSTGVNVFMEVTKNRA